MWWQNFCHMSRSLRALSDSREAVLVLEANEQKWLQPQVESWLLTKHWKGGMASSTSRSQGNWLKNVMWTYLKELGPSIPKEPQCWDSQISVLPLILVPPIFLPTNWAHIRFQSNANPSRSTRFSESLDGLDLSFPGKLPAVLVCQTSVGGYAKTQRGVLGRSGFRDGTSHRLPKHEGMVCHWEMASKICQGFGPHRIQARGGTFCQIGWVWLESVKPTEG